MPPPRKKQTSGKAATPAPKKRARKPGETHVDTKTAVSPAVGQARERIDSIDQHIQELIAERANWAQQVGRAKGPLKAAIDYYRPEREAQVLRKVEDRNDGPLSDEVLELGRAHV